MSEAVAARKLFSVLFQGNPEFFRSLTTAFASELQQNIWSTNKLSRNSIVNLLDFAALEGVCGQVAGSEVAQTEASFSKKQNLTEAAISGIAVGIHLQDRYPVGGSRLN